jgi:hypothetical protein
MVEQVGRLSVILHHWQRLFLAGLNRLQAKRIFPLKMTFLRLVRHTFGSDFLFLFIWLTKQGDGGTFDECETWRLTVRPARRQNIS